MNEMNNKITVCILDSTIQLVLQENINKKNKTYREQRNKTNKNVKKIANANQITRKYSKLNRPQNKLSRIKTSTEDNIKTNSADKNTNQNLTLVETTFLEI